MCRRYPGIRRMIEHPSVFERSYFVASQRSTRKCGPARRWLQGWEPGVNDIMRIVRTYAPGAWSMAWARIAIIPWILLSANWHKFLKDPMQVAAAACEWADSSWS